MCSAEHPSGFHRVGRRPFIDSFTVDEILARHPTPLIVYSAARLRDNARELRAALGPRTRLLYSYKACYLPGVLRILHESGLDAEVCSGGEYLLARKMGLEVGRIAWNAVGLSEREADLAVSAGVSWLGLNTLDDIARVAAAAARRDRQVSVMIRIQPAGVDSPYLGPDSRLGFHVDDGGAMDAVRAVLQHPQLRFRGLHSHTQVRQVDPALHAAAAQSSFAFANQVTAETGVPVHTVSIGGGLADHEQMRRQGTDVDAFGAALLAAAALTGSPPGPPELAIEPGRFLVSDTAIGLTSVLATAGGRGQQPWLIVDLGTQVLVPFEGREFEVFAAELGTDAEISMGVGDRMSSYSGVINQSARLPQDIAGGLLVIADMGAYTSSVAQHFMYGLPEVILLDGKQMLTISNPQGEEEWVGRLFETVRVDHRNRP